MYSLPINNRTYKNFQDRVLNQWDKNQVTSAVDDLLTIFHSEGIDVDNVIVDKLMYEFINVEMDVDVLGTAYTGRTLKEPSIYLYGSYSKNRPILESYTLAIHEFSHYINSNFILVSDFNEYAKMRGIPEDWMKEKYEWKRNPREVFAEDLTQIIMENRNYDKFRSQENQGHKYNNRTHMPNLTESQKSELSKFIFDTIKHRINSSNNLKYNKDMNYTNIKNNQNSIGLGNLKCKVEIDNYLKKDATAQELSDWLMSLNSSEANKLNTINYLKGIGNNAVKSEELMKNLIKDKESLKSSYVKSKNNYWSNYLKNNSVKIFGNAELNESYAVLSKLEITNSKMLNPQNQHQTIRRSEAMEMLYNALGYNLNNYKNENDLSYMDIPRGSDLEKIAVTLNNEGIFYGYGDGRFGVNDELTREQMIMILNRAYEFKATKKSNYKDAGKISPSAKESVDALFANGIVIGDSKGFLDPKSSVTKGQFSLMLKRAYLKSGKGMIPGEDSTVYDAINALHDEIKGSKGLLSNKKVTEAKLRLIK